MLKSLDGSIIAIIILLIILGQVYDRSRNSFSQYRLFTYMVVSDLLLLIVDLLTWYFNGRSGLINTAASYLVNLMAFCLLPLPSALFVFYTDELISFGSKKLKKLKTLIVSLIAVNAAISITSVFTGWFFYIDTANMYHRGKLFFLHEILCAALLVYSFYAIFKNKSKFHKGYFSALLLFCVPIAAGIIIQTLFYGYSAVLIGISLSLLIVYVNIQSRNLNIDYLTGISNRRYLDEYLAVKTNIHKRSNAFSAIMIDVDEFKQINDNFGHETGDMALKDAVQIIKSCLRHDDFIARIGGDEFIMIINADTRQALIQVVNKIKDNVERFNVESNRPYNISFSYGFSLYNKDTKMKAGEFINYIDMLMYEDKNKKSLPINKKTI